MASATDLDLQELKEQWRSDPIWDIEETEGYEDHYDELKTYRLQWEKIWETEREKNLIEKAKKMGIPDNLDLVRYIEFLEYRISDLEAKAV